MSALARAEGRSGPVGGRASDATARRPTRSPRPGEGPVFFAAGFWRRAAAAAIDAALVLPVGAGVAWMAQALSGLGLPRGESEGLELWLDLLLALDPALVSAIGLMLAVLLLYSLIFTGAAAQTPGMRVLSIRVIDAYGDPPSMARATARAAGSLAAVATLGLGFLWIALDREKRGLADWLAGTYVVKA
jgi:uncharacterized RDD family membrane protein YckC